MAISVVKERQLKGVTEVNYSYIGYFPSVALSKILSLLKSYLGTQPLTILKLQTNRHRMLHRNTVNPLPYVTITTIAAIEANVEYSFVRYPTIDLPTMEKVLRENGIAEMVVTELVVGLPKTKIWPKFKPEGKNPLDRDINTAVIFKRKYVGEGETERRQKVEDASSDELKKSTRFKHSALDLMGVQDAKAWGSGSKQEFIHLRHSGDNRLIKTVMTAVDPDRLAARLCDFRQGRKREWVQVADYSLAEA